MDPVKDYKKQELSEMSITAVKILLCVMLLFGIYHVNGLLSFLLCLMIPLGLIIYLTIIKLFLKRNFIVPDLCSTGERAIELCKEKKYDLILLDHMMPWPAAGSSSA